MNIQYHEVSLTHVQDSLDTGNIKWKKQPRRQLKVGILAKKLGHILLSLHIMHKFLQQLNFDRSDLILRVSKPLFLIWVAKKKMVSNSVSNYALVLPHRLQSCSHGEREKKKKRKIERRKKKKKKKKQVLSHIGTVLYQMSFGISFNGC